MSPGVYELKPVPPSAASKVRSWDMTGVVPPDEAKGEVAVTLVTPPPLPEPICAKFIAVVPTVTVVVPVKAQVVVARVAPPTTKVASPGSISLLWSKSEERVRTYAKMPLPGTVTV